MPQMNFRISDQQKEAWTKRAADEGLPLPDLIRQTMDVSCRLEAEARSVPAAIRKVEQQIERIAEHETTRKKKSMAPAMPPGGFQPCPSCDNPRCGRLGVPLCAPCQVASSKAAPPAAETFESIV